MAKTKNTVKIKDSYIRKSGVNVKQRARIIVAGKLEDSVKDSENEIVIEDSFIDSNGIEVDQKGNVIIYEPFGEAYEKAEEARFGSFKAKDYRLAV